MAAKKKGGGNVGRRGEGLKQLEKGKWLARLFWIDPRTGKEREKRITFDAPSKWQAVKRRTEELEKAKNADDVVLVQKRFGEVADEWTATIKVLGTKLSEESRVRTLKAHFGDWYLDKVSARAMQQYLDALTISSVNNVRATLVNVFRYAVRKHYIAENVAKQTERRRGSNSDDDENELAPERALSPEQVLALFEDLQENDPLVYPLIHVQYMIGCRFAEVSALRREDLNLQTGIVLVRKGQYRGTQGKTKGKYGRKAGLSLETRSMLRAHLDQMEYEQWPGWEEIVFPRPVSGHKRKSNYWAISAVDKKLRAAFKRLGITGPGTTHRARHTAVTLADELGIAEGLARKVFGHRSTKHRAAYQHPTDSSVIKFAETVGKKLRRNR